MLSGLRNVAIVALAGVGSIAVTPIVASAHIPDDGGSYPWTCAGGNGGGPPGTCCRHNSSYPSGINWHFANVCSNQAAIRAGANLWDNFHPINFAEDNYPVHGLQGFPLTCLTTFVCGPVPAGGCEGSTSSGVHKTTTYIKIKIGTAYTTTAGQEFGHSAGLGHSGVSGNVMKSASVLGGGDKEGICQIYGHSHSWGSSCVCPK